MSTDFGRTTLPFCSFVGPGEKRARVGVGIGTDVLDLTISASARLASGERLALGRVDGQVTA